MSKTLTIGAPPKGRPVTVKVDPGVYRVEIPGAHPPTLNKLTRGKFRDRIRLGKEFRELVLAYCLMCRVPAACRKRRVTLGIVLGPNRRGADPDAYWKATLDSLKKAGAIVDDSRHWVELMPVAYEHGHYDKTVIVLEDIP